MKEIGDLSYTYLVGCWYVHGCWRFRNRIFPISIEGYYPGKGKKTDDYEYALSPSKRRAARRQRARTAGKPIPIFPEDLMDSRPRDWKEL